MYCYMIVLFIAFNFFFILLITKIVVLIIHILYSILQFNKLDPLIVILKVITIHLGLAQMVTQG